MVKGRKQLAADHAPHLSDNIDAPPVLLTPASSVSSVVSTLDTHSEDVQHNKRVLALAPAFQPRAVSFPVQFLPPTTTGAPSVPVAPIRTSAGVGATVVVGRSRAGSNASVRHLRSVSLPDVMAAPRPVSPSTQYNDAYDVLAAKYLKTPQIPHLAGTPSPPSSPDSVLFIEQTPSGGLPHHLFRRRRGNSVAFVVDNQEPVQPVEQIEQVGEDGWVTWGSPPRPIPALHGPASLPYARCPSGAEGTVIEEQSSLPTVIWGLDGHTEDGNHVKHTAPEFVPHVRNVASRPYNGNKDRKGVRGPRQTRARPHIHESPYRPHMPLEDVYSATKVAPGLAQAPVIYEHDELEDDPIFARLRREAAQKMDQQTKRFRGHTISGSKPTDLLTLLNVDHDNDTSPITDRATLLARLSNNGLLPTPPPGLTTPVFASAFSPLTPEEREVLQRRFGDMLQSPNTPGSLISGTSSATERSPSTHELSEQLRRLVLGPLRQNEYQSMPRQAMSLPATPLMPSVPSMPNYRSPGAQVAADGKNISVWDIVNGRSQQPHTQLQQQHQEAEQHLMQQHHVVQQQQKGAGNKKVAPVSPGTNLGARSIPLSRLRQNSGGLHGLPPVPEEPETGHSQSQRRVNQRTPSSPNTAKKSSKASTATSWRKASAPKTAPGDQENAHLPVTVVTQSRTDDPVVHDAGEPKVKLNASLPSNNGGGARIKKLRPKADKPKADISFLQLDTPTAEPVSAPVNVVGVMV